MKQLTKAALQISLFSARHEKWSLNDNNKEKAANDDSSIWANTYTILADRPPPKPVNSSYFLQASSNYSDPNSHGNDCSNVYAASQPAARQLIQLAPHHSRILLDYVSISELFWLHFSDRTEKKRIKTTNMHACIYTSVYICIQTRLGILPKKLRIDNHHWPIGIKLWMIKGKKIRQKYTLFGHIKYITTIFFCFGRKYRSSQQIEGRLISLVISIRSANPARK